MTYYLPDEARSSDAAAVLRFWFGEPPEYGTQLKRWFEKDPSFDAAVRAQFLPLYERLSAEGALEWLRPRADCLARIIVLDQFPRQMFRGAGRAFAADALALSTARYALGEGYDRGLLPVERLFLYLPLEHSEALADQDRSCELNEPLTAFPETGDIYRYALAHRDIVRRFGRFPHRNAALGRTSTAEEIEFLRQPGSSF